MLATRVSNFVGLYDMMKQYGIKASEVNTILDVLPEFALQNRKDMLRNKVNIIRLESGRNQIYLRNFIKRHPDILMK